jgi:two-component system repressor protein LuxO
MTAKRSVLIVEDAVSLGQLYAMQLSAGGFVAEHVGSAGEARERLSRRSFDAVLLDVGLPDADGIAFMREVAARKDPPVAVAITANGSIAKAVHAVREGAADFLVKPVAKDRLVAAVNAALAAKRKRMRCEEPQSTAAPAPIEGFVGVSPVMMEVYRSIEHVAASRAPVFVTGESGTGKELCAEAIHRLSRRAAGPFVAVNCGAIPKDLMESEIFGHLKGSFTGAIADRDGAAKLASGGTLFLDEICEMDLALQTKLLRFLQTGVIQRVGAPAPEAVDVRIVCATNRDPALEIQAGRFRSDLYYRLHVLPIRMPALRERGDDIVLLARHFLEAAAIEENRPAPELDGETARRLLAHDWPGNVRELQNVIRQAVVLNRDICIEGHSPQMHFAAGDLRHVEREAIESAIMQCGGSIPKAARRLGISPSTIYRKRETWAGAVAN